MLCYCKKCGRIILLPFDKDEKICDCCKSKVFPIPEHYLCSEYAIKDELKQQFIDEYVKSSPEFDQYLFERRDDILAQQSSGFFLEERNRGPKCPSCGSTNISKIGFLNRAVSTGFLGLASSKIGKTHKCNNCGSMW